MMPIVSESLDKKITYIRNGVTLKEDVVLTEEEKKEFEELKERLKKGRSLIFE